MKEKKWIEKLLLLAGLAIVMSACGAKASDTKTASSANTIVLITMDSLDEHWLSVKQGAEEAIKAFPDYNLVFRAPAGKTDPIEQTRMVEDAINQQAKAILLAPNDGAALAPVATKVKEANIPLILIDSPLNSEDYTSFVATDNEAAGSMAAENLAKLLNNQGKIAIVHAQAGSSSAIARGKGFEDKIKVIAPNIQIISVQYSDGDKARALNIATDIMTANPDLAGFYTTNEGSTVGVSRAISEAKVADKVMLVGFDKSKDTIAALENGSLKATMVQNPDIMGKLAIEQAIAAINGESVARKSDTGVSIITKENVAQLK